MNWRGTIKLKINQKHLLLLLVWVFSSVTVFSSPTEEDLSKALGMAKKGQLNDAYYLDQLYKNCGNVSEVEELYSLLSSELIEPAYKAYNKIAKARRTEYFGDHERAFALLKSIRENDFESQSKAIQSEYYNASGYIAINSGNPELALKQYKKALSLAEDSDNIEFIQSRYMSVGVAYNALKRYPEAMANFKKAQSLETNGPNRNSLYIKLNLALTLSNQGKLEQAKETFQSALAIVKAKKDIYAEIRTLSNIADIYILQDSLENAIKLLNQSETLIYKSGQTLDLIFVKTKLSEIYAKQENYKKAYDQVLEVNKIQTEFNYKADIGTKIRGLESSEELKKSNKEKQLIDEARKREVRIRWIISAILAVVTILSIVVLLLFYKNRRKSKLLIKHEKQKLDSNKPKSDKGAIIYEKLETLADAESIYKNADLTIEKTAKLLETNRTYLSESINSQFGASFSQWLVSKRINASKKLLSSPDYDQYSIEGIAETVGFSSISTFNTNFKRLTGVTPSYFRKELKN